MVTQRKEGVNADDTAFVYGGVVFASVDATTVEGKPQRYAFETRDSFGTRRTMLTDERAASSMSMDRNYRHRGQQRVQTLSWRTFADILHAAKIYE